MLLLNALLVSLVPGVTLATATPRGDHWGPPHGKNCLSYAEALDISTRWLSVFSTGEVTSKKQLATIVSQDIASYDDTFGNPTFGIGELWAAINYGGKTTTTNVKQTPLFSIHTCDQIGLNWVYNAVTTGYKSSVPAGTPVSFKGNDLLHIDLESRLIFNATSCGDWILLSQQLGHKCTV